MCERHVPRLNTASVIARQLKVPTRRVQYVLETRHHIQPRAFAGNARLYDRRAIAQIRHELNAIDARREARRSGGGA
jgi:hypothetical protein